MINDFFEKYGMFIFVTALILGLLLLVTAEFGETQYIRPDGVICNSGSSANCGMTLYNCEDGATMRCVTDVKSIEVNTDG